ncbi:hypothetical protein QYE76_047655 [Lolium multiflorum]|uniref:Uncharacterized protein n=1 Tax=Lolium multiflorum TaxID=4521 RepID=A0AAD8WZI0_LOLMU|nr:hypothetical protein QYE76_047655 [Lolium multiflorum]
MKGFAAELAAAGKKFDDDELKDYILNGLDGSYTPLVTSINANPSTTLGDMCSQLLSYESRESMLVATGQNTGTFTSSINAAPRRPTFPHHAPPKPPILPTPPSYHATPPPPQPYIHHNPKPLYPTPKPHLSPTCTIPMLLPTTHHHKHTHSTQTSSHAHLYRHHRPTVAHLKPNRIASPKEAVVRAVVARIELQVSGNRGSSVKFARRRAIPPLNVGGAMVMTMMMMMHLMSTRVHMVSIQIGSSTQVSVTEESPRSSEAPQQNYPENSESPLDPVPDDPDAQSRGHASLRLSYDATSTPGPGSTSRSARTGPRQGEAATSPPVSGRDTSPPRSPSPPPRDSPRSLPPDHMPSDADPAQSGGGEASSVAGEIPLCPDLLHHLELEPILLLDLLHQQMLQPVLLLNRALVYKKSDTGANPSDRLQPNARRLLLPPLPPARAAVAADQLQRCWGFCIAATLRWRRLRTGMVF